MKHRPTGSKLICGVGINDSVYAITRYTMVDGKKKKVWQCPFYTVWQNMIERAYSETYKARHPTYKECSVVSEWHTFSTFRLWMEQQPWEGNHLDKDILVKGNKIYGPEFCVFVSNKLNAFLIGNGVCRGNLPMGAMKCGRRFQAQIRNSVTGEDEMWGIFDNPEDAHLAWKERKHELACQLADMQTDGRVAYALREYFK